MRKLYKVLFFVTGMTPTSTQRDEALNFGPHVSFRNALHIQPEDTLEDCDAVYGPAVPSRYAARYPWACSVADFYAGKLDPVPMAPAEPVEDAPDSGAGTEAFNPFAPVSAAARRAADWQAQG